MKVLITNPPWLYRKGLSKRFGVRVGSRWPFSYEIPTVYTRLYHFCQRLKEEKIKDILRKLIQRYNTKKREHTLLQPFLQYVPYPIFMGYTTSFLRSKGIETIFYDAGAQYHNYRTFFKTVDMIKPDIVIQETSTASYSLDLEIAQKLHKKYEICLAGPQATVFAERLVNLPYVDYVLRGAYEYPALEMVQTRRKGVYNYHIANLDDLPYPYIDARIIHHYRDFNCLKKLAFPQLWTYASRGCTFHCDFCYWVHVMFNRKLSLRRSEKIIDEVDDRARKYGFRHVYFDDDCWNIGPEGRLMKIADGMREINLPWTINARLDLSTKEMFRYFVDRGCVGLRLGVESLSQHLLDLTHKDLKVETILDKIKYLEKLDVELYLLFMHYVPGETDADREEQKRQIKKLGHRYQNPPCIPLPGTPYYQKIIQTGFSLEGVDWSEFDAGNLGKNLLQMAKNYTQRLTEESL